MVTTGDTGKIVILPSDVVSRIAAGEVIERPAAVVKELVENSLDAGACSIAVDVKDGGLSLIRVTDDGEGMSREDAPLAFERHATSKLRSDRDLWSVRTMGFRGEALPSIASVSDVRVATATRAARVGTEFQVKAGRIERIVDAPPVAGTRIEVTDLFHNQPARKKFLKSIPTEFAHISRVIQQAALAWPSVHFLLTHNGQEILNFPAVSSGRDRVAQVFPRDFVERSVVLSAASPGASVSGFAINAVYARTSRTPQELFVNRRPVRNSAVFHAVSEGYGSFLSKGRNPLFVLFVDVDPELVDVNVHPAKREVRFSDGEAIHQLVRRAIRSALGGADRAPLAVRDSGNPFATAGGNAASMAAEPARQRGASSIAWPFPHRVESGASLREERNRPGEHIQAAFVNEAAESYLRAPSAEVTALGQINRTFLIVQVGGDLTVIDQHTAHERVLFERLFRAWTERGILSQPLLIPEPVELSAPQVALFQRHQVELEQLGLGLEPFGATTVLLRAVPAGVGRLDPRILIEDLLDDLGQWEVRSDLEAKVRPVLASLACHSAVRSGRSMELAEIKVLVEDWIAEGKITTCPHGRRTSFTLSTIDLEKMFGRAGW